MSLSDWLGPVLGLAGIPLGLLLGEYLRCRRRAESFATAIFDKRLQAYEKLMQLVNDGSMIAAEVINNVGLSNEDRNELISAAIIPIAQHTDQNLFYINSDLGAH